MILEGRTTFCGVITVADPEEEPAPLFLDQTETRRPKKILLRPPALLSQGLDKQTLPSYLKAHLSATDGSSLQPGNAKQNCLAVITH